MMTGAPVRWPERISGFRSRVINDIIDALDSLRPLPSRTVRHTWRSDGLMAHASAGYGEKETRQSWDLEFTAGNVAKIYTGDLDLGDLGSIAASHAGLTLTGATAWIYAERLRGASSATIKYSATKPQSDSTGLRKRLWHLTSADGGATYSVTRDCRLDAQYGSVLL